MTNFSARSKAINTARHLAERTPLFLDTETTGINNLAEIVEIAIAGSEGQILFESLVKPVQLIPPDASRIHGISNADTADAPTWVEIWPQVSDILRGKLVGMYNSDYDVRLMRQSSQIRGINWPASLFESFCVMKLFAEYAGEWNAQRQSYRWFTLEKAALHCRLPLPTLHRAPADTQLTCSVFNCIAASTPTLF